MENKDLILVRELFGKIPIKYTKVTDFTEDYIKKNSAWPLENSPDLIEKLGKDLTLYDVARIIGLYNHHIGPKFGVDKREWWDIDYIVLDKKTCCGTLFIQFLIEDSSMPPCKERIEEMVAEDAIYGYYALHVNMAGYIGGRVHGNKAGKSDNKDAE